MKHPRGKLSFHEIHSGETPVFSNVMGLQNEKPNRFLETVTSYEVPRGKLHLNFSQNAFTRNPFVYKFRPGALDISFHVIFVRTLVSLNIFVVSSVIRI